VADVHRLLRASRLFQGLSDDLLLRLERDTQLRRFVGGEALWTAGDRAESFNIVATGLVQILQRLPSGDAALLGVFGPHECIGIAASLEASNYPADCQALTEEVQVLRIHAAPMLEITRTDVTVANALNSALLEHTKALRAKINIMSAGTVSERLLMLFDHLADRFGDEREDSSTVIPVVLSRTALAWLVGARVETVIRAMTRWQREGWIETNREGFIIYARPTTNLASPELD
jgi:CRP-like cAMP-binding protein